MGARVTIADVAARAGVSISTVSLVLNNKPTRISEETRERVRQAAQDIGYSPNKVAQGLRRRLTHTLGLISDSIATTPYAGQMLAGAQDVARENGYMLFFVDTGADAEIEEQAVSQMQAQQVDALIFAAMWHREVTPPTNLPNKAVYLDCFSQTSPRPSVVPDEIAGGRAAVQYLVNAGHRRIAYVDVDENPPPIASKLRHRGYLAIHEENHLPVDPALHVKGASTHDGGRQATEKLLALPKEERPTAIFCFNDRMAAGVYTALRSHGFEIPSDMSVVGYDDQQLVAAELYPPLTTVALPHYEMGKWATEVALGIRPHSGTDPPHLMSCPLITRESVASPPVGAPTHPGGEA